MAQELDSFTRAYLECALWASTDNEDNPLDDGRDFSDYSDEALAKMTADCAKFQELATQWLTSDNCLTRYSPCEQGGYDFWLTRNGHGAGFWETSDWTEDSGKELTRIAKSFGECNLYVGDEGKVHCE